MAFDFLRQGDCTFFGPALPEPYVRFELEKALSKHKLLPDTEGLAGQTFRDNWDIFRRKLRDVSPNSGPVAITNRILDPLVSRLGYVSLTAAENVLTREGDESGGSLMMGAGGAKLRCWAIDFDADLDSPTQRGYAYRFSPVRVAQRVLLATGERVGLLTNGVELRLLLCDPARPDSHVEIDLNVWRLSRDLPDGYQLLIALASPAGVAALPQIIDDARLKQNKVTKELRVQSRRAVEEFVQAVIDHPDNVAALASHADKSALAKALWHEGLIVVYRLLFILKCESTSDPSRVFRFASTPLWRKTYSPSTALAHIVRRVLDDGAPSGRYLEDGLRVLFKLFANGLDHPGLTVRPLGGALFGNQATPLLSPLRWGELAVAHLLNRLLWSDTKRGRERVHYGPLDVEDLGRVYEALLELEPGIATEAMCRLRRSKLEVVVPAAQGEKYKPAGGGTSVSTADDGDEESDTTEPEESEDEAPARGKKTKVEWIETIAPGRFYLRVGLGRKSSGSYYTPHSFVRFLVQETLGPQCDERSPRDNPNPGAILKLKVLDPACGSGHFLVEACRFLAGRVYEAARLCDELATKAEHDAEAEKNAARKQSLLDRAAELRKRLQDLPDQEDELLSYLPSRSAGADKAGLSAHDIARAEGICRRLVAVHCIYGADINPLAVELAKLSLWIESHAEGFPLTFLDHRIVVGNSLTGPFWDKLKYAPGSQQLVSDLFRQSLDLKLAAKVTEALSFVRELEASVGVDVSDIAAKEQLKRELDTRLLPFRILAAAWAGGVMLGTDQPDGTPRCDDDAYADILKHIGTTGELPATIDNANLRAMIEKGKLALSYDLAFPEVFHPTGQPHGRQGFDAVIGNPPWDTVTIKEKEWFAGHEFTVIDAKTKRERDAIIERILAKGDLAREYQCYVDGFEATKRLFDSLYEYQKVFIDGDLAGRFLDLFRVFMERNAQLLGPVAVTGVVVPSAFHANEGATGVRQLYLEKMALRFCFSFENKNKLFEIHSSFKFALVVAQKGKATEQFSCGFYLHDDQWLFDGDPSSLRLVYTAELVRRTGGDFLVFLELTHDADVHIAAKAYTSTVNLGDIWDAEAQAFSTAEMNLTLDFERLVSLEQFGVTDGWLNAANLQALLNQEALPLAEGKSLWHFDIQFSGDARFAIPLSRLVDRPHWFRIARFYRAAYRKIASSTNERTMVWALIPPGPVTCESCPSERGPDKRANAVLLHRLAILNAFVADYVLRLRVAATVSMFMLRLVPVPQVTASCALFLAHSALRLQAQDDQYAPLWREQLDDAWRESIKAPFTWPVLAGDDERWEVRAAIDAVVADAYGLSREQYAHVLLTFSHSSYKKAPDLCLAAFDELKATGLEAFYKKHDPYWDIPLVETLPKPVIDLPTPDPAGGPDSSANRSKRSGRNGKSAVAAGPGLFDLATPSSPAEPDAAKIQAVKTMLELRRVVTSAEIQQQFGFESASVKAILKQLTASGFAVVEGKARGTKYRLAAR